MAKPTPEVPTLTIQKLRERITKRLRSSRERSLALTKLEEAQMWLEKAIVVDAEKKEQ